MPEIILHHYPRSPYAEKTRLALGLKGVAYHSVTVPSWMPKPDLVALTGGYRRTPVMQVGADVFCDTLVILQAIDRIVPDPPLFPKGGREIAVALGWGLERSLFLSAIGIVIGLHGTSYPPEVIKDRRPFFGFSIEPAEMRARQAQFVDRFNAQATGLTGMLSDGRPFLLGSEPSAADLCAYHPLWHLRHNGGDEAMTLLPIVGTLLPWMDRIASIGHGMPQDLSASDALAIAASAQPAVRWPGDDMCPLAGVKPGQRISVTPDDFGRDPVVGSLVAVRSDSVVLRRVDDRLGSVDVHFPRVGFDVGPADRQGTAA